MCKLCGRKTERLATYYHDQEAVEICFYCEAKITAAVADPRMDGHVDWFKLAQYMRHKQCQRKIEEKR